MNSLGEFRSIIEPFLQGEFRIANGSDNRYYAVTDNTQDTMYMESWRSEVEVQWGRTVEGTYPEYTLTEIAHIADCAKMDVGPRMPVCSINLEFYGLCGGASSTFTSSINEDIYDATDRLRKSAEKVQRGVYVVSMPIGVDKGELLSLGYKLIGNGNIWFINKASLMWSQSIIKSKLKQKS